MKLEDMEKAVAGLKTYFHKKKDTDILCRETVPQLGFKISLCEARSELKVKVIGARQLPGEFGSSGKPRGYLIKVTIYPFREKFETKIVKDSWPTINEEFTCSLNGNGMRYDDLLKGKFISFTIYAILGKLEDEPAPLERPRGVLRRYFSFDEGEGVFTRNGSMRRSGSTRRSSYTTSSSMNNRRTVGAVTYKLEKKLFTQKLKNDVISTPDIWRNVENITSGVQTQPRDGTKGSIELTLQYAVSEDGKNDVVEISVTKFRCSLQTMQHHEKVGGQLYIKITAFEYDDLVQKMKSDKFDPTINLKLEANTSTLRANVNKFNLDQMKILIRLISKNIMGKKVVLGKLEIDSRSSFWKEIVTQPLVPLTKMINFE